MNYIVTSSNGKNKKNSRTNSAKSAGTNNAKSAIQYKKMTGKKDDPKLTTFFQAKGSTSAKSVSVKRSSSNEGVINLTNDSPMKPASKKSKHKAFKQASSKECIELLEESSDEDFPIQAKKKENLNNSPRKANTKTETECDGEESDSDSEFEFNLDNDMLWVWQQFAHTRWESISSIVT